MRIQHTNIEKRKDDLYIVDILIADSPNTDEGREKIHLVCHINPEKRVALPILEIAVLDRVQNILNEQILALSRP